METLLRLGLVFWLVQMLLKSSARVSQRRLLSSEPDGLPFAPEKHSDWV